MVSRKSLIIGLGLLLVGSATVWAASGQIGPFSDDDMPADHYARHGRAMQGGQMGMGMGGPGQGHGAHGGHDHDGNHTHGDPGHGPRMAGGPRHHPPGHGIIQVARCLSDENRTADQCVALAADLVQDKIDRAEQCLANHTAGECARHAGPPVGRLVHCVADQGAEACAETTTTRVVCVASRIAGVESPLECPTPPQDEDSDPQ